jgi:GxxExxY protein
MYEVNKKPGIGFLETVYQEALEIEIKKAEIPYERENNQSYSLIHPCLSVSVRGYFEIGIAGGYAFT